MGSLVLKGGRVIDPATGRDEIADVVIESGKVTAIGSGLSADTTIDVTGHVVGPGFIDLHSHVNSIAGQRLQALDGVTTALELEAGLWPVATAYELAADAGRPLNYGFAASWCGARAVVLAGIDQRGDIAEALKTLGNPQWQGSSTKAQLDNWIGLLRGELEAGGLGIGILQGYAPLSDPAEFLAVAALAAEAGVPTFTHSREIVEANPDTPIDGAEELRRAAGETGAHMHQCHVNSTSRRHIERVLSTLSKAQAEGSTLTIEAYPYGAGSTGVGAAFLAPEKLDAWGVKPSNIMLLPSGEVIADVARLTEIRETAPGTPCIITYLDENDPSDKALLHQSLAYEDSIVASDAMPIFFLDGSNETREWPLPAGGSTHPRTAGTFARVLRQMVRETGEWSWVEAFRRCSYLPAQVMSFTSDMAGKGHLSIGADADLVVINPDTVTDTATYLNPTSVSVGVQHLFVAGQPVVADGALVTNAFPGKPVRGQIA